MTINGFQFYWIFAIGLLVGLVLAIAIGIAGPIVTDDPLISIPLIVAFLYATVAIFVVLLEIWDRFGLGMAIAAAIAVPAIVIYWFNRVGDVSEHKPEIYECRAALLAECSRWAARLLRGCL
jgi:hypothetical protein